MPGGIGGLPDREIDRLLICRREGAQVGIAGDGPPIAQELGLADFCGVYREAEQKKRAERLADRANFHIADIALWPKESNLGIVSGGLCLVDVTCINHEFFLTRLRRT